MKKIILVLILMLIPTIASADSINLTCNDTFVAPNSTVTCTIRGTTSSEVSSVHAKIETGSNLTLTSVTKNSIWEGSGSEGIIDLYTDTNKTGTFNIATFTVLVGKSAGTSSTISIKNVEYSDANFKLVYLSNTSISIKTGSTNNNLSSLSISGANISFNKNTTNYTVTIDSASTSIKATAEDSKAKISGDIGTKTLKHGTNTFYVKVTNEIGNIKTYTIKVIRPENKDTTTTKVVKTETTTKKVIKTETTTTTKSINNNLKSIEIKEGKISFNKNKVEYNISVSNETNSINIKAIAEDSKAKVTIQGNKNLVVGVNTVIVKVTAENGSVKEYKIFVERKDSNNEKLSNDSSLSSIVIDNYNLEFKENSYTYDLSVKDDNSLNIVATPSDSKATVKISGNENLKNGNKIKITVIAEDETSSVYTINIIKEKDNSFNWIIPIIIFETIIILITCFIFILQETNIFKKKN